MERINYVNKARQFMARSARAATLVILPLAAASGSVIFPLGHDCILTGGLGDGNCTNSSVATQLGNPGNNILGVSFALTKPAIFGLSGSGNNSLVQFVDRGTTGGSGIAPTNTAIVVHWNFSVSLQGDATVDSNWQAIIDILSDDGNTTFAHGIFDTGGKTGTIIGGNQVVLERPLAAGTPVEIHFFLTEQGGGSNNSAGTLTVQIPQGSTLDLNSVPEPSSAGLLAIGAGLVAWVVRRQRQKALRKVPPAQGGA